MRRTDVRTALAAVRRLPDAPAESDCPRCRELERAIARAAIALRQMPTAVLAAPPAPLRDLFEALRDPATVACLQAIVDREQRG